jgi:hypothetical protein
MIMAPCLVQKYGAAPRTDGRFLRLSGFVNDLRALIIPYGAPIEAPNQSPGFLGQITRRERGVFGSHRELALILSRLILLLLAGLPGRFLARGDGELRAERFSHNPLGDAP